MRFNDGKKESSLFPDITMNFMTQADGSVRLIPFSTIDEATNRILCKCDNCGYETYLPPAHEKIIRKCEQCKETTQFDIAHH